MHLNFDLLMIIIIMSDICFSIMRPNVILEKPIIICESERILIQVRTSKSNPSHIYAEDHIDDPDCASRNVNQISLSLGNCGMTVKKTKNPASIIYRICITIQLHPFFITDSDRSYCARCVYKDADIIDDLQQLLSVSDSTPSDLESQFDLVAPRCSYQIRRNSIDGPLIRYALLGETVYHVWKCYGENFQILVQNCYVEDGEGNHILIISSDGCGVDQYILQTPIYSLDQRSASQEMHVFKFAGKAITRFTCQIRICSPSNDSCHISALHARCIRNEEHDTEINKTNKPMGTFGWTNRPSSTFVQAPSTNRIQTVSATRELSLETTTIATMSKGSWNVATKKLDLIALPATVTEAPVAEEPFFLSSTDNYGFYMESSNALPPAIQPSSRNSEDEIQVEPSIYQRRAKRNTFTNKLIKRNASLEFSKSNKDHNNHSLDVSGMLTVLESPDDVAYLESEYQSTGTLHDTAAPCIKNAGNHSLVRCVPQFVFLALIGIIALSVILISITIPCIFNSRPC